MLIAHCQLFIRPPKEIPQPPPAPVGDKFRWRRPWRAPPPPERPVPRGPPGETFPGHRSPVEKIANDSAPPAGGSRGGLFGGGMQKQEHIAIQSNLPCISGNRTAVMGCSVFNSMGAFIRNILAFVLALYWPLHSIYRLLPIAHCSLLIAHCKLFHPSPKEIPRRRPPGIPYLQYCMQ